MPKEPELPEDGAAYRAAAARHVRPWAWSGFALALAGVAAMAATGFENAAAIGLFAAGVALQAYAIVRRRRFQKSYIASHRL